jgi:hypothetical protein
MITLKNHVVTVRRRFFFLYLSARSEYEDDWGDQRELLDKAVEEFIAKSRKALRVKD